ncbi:MAG: TolC family protein, partial [Pseudomonadota bacterium]
FTKPTYLTRVLDPQMTGGVVRDNVRNLRSYISVNEAVDVFERLGTLFNARRVGVVVPLSGLQAEGTIGPAVKAAAQKAGIVDVRFIGLDPGRSIDAQLTGIDAAIIPPADTTEAFRRSLLQALQRKRIPSYAVGGRSLVLEGALISDTVDEEVRVLARRIALDLQLAINGETRPRGVRLLQSKKQTTINIDTARALNIDFSLDELLTARVVRGNSGNLALTLMAAIELATDRNSSLRGQLQQLEIDKESLAQARIARRPQLASQLVHTRRGEQLPERESLAAISLSQTLYSATANANVESSQLLVDASEQSLEQSRLDTVQQTANAYLQALQAQAQFETALRDLELNRDNLSLAEQRLRSGSGSGADIYRWQAVIAGSENAVLNAFTSNNAAQNQLALVLSTQLPIPVTLAEVDLTGPPFDLLHDALEPWLTSTGRAERLRQATAARAIDRSPQLRSAEANVAVSNSQLKAVRRSFYTPDISLSAQYSQFIDSTVNAAGIELDDVDDWSLSVTATLPLWDSGNRRSSIRQITAQRELGQSQIDNLKIALWSNSSLSVDNLVANYRSIAVSQRAEEAARRSQQITQQAYRLGAASVTDLLDTQNTYRDAQDNSTIARHQYLRSLVDFQAALGEMPMLFTGGEQQRWLGEFTRTLLGNVVDDEAKADTTATTDTTDQKTDTANDVTFRIQPGESLWDFAIRTTGDALNWKSIAQYNQIAESQIKRIPAGRVINVPREMVAEQ